MKRKFSLEKELRDSFRFIKESKNFIYFVIGSFLVFAIMGFFVSLPEMFSNQLMDYLKALVDQTKDFGVLEMILFLFQNNAFAGLVGLILGFVFGIFPFFNSVANGFVLGFVAKLSVTENGFFSLWRIFPHGIFELPALFISLGLGLKFGSFIFEKDRRKAFREYFYRGIKTYVLVILPLLVLAAIIEGILIVIGN